MSSSILEFSTINHTDLRDHEVLKAVPPVLSDLLLRVKSISHADSSELSVLTEQTVYKGFREHERYYSGMYTCLRMNKIKAFDIL